MSRNYKFHNPDGLYFITFTVVEWLDVFTRRQYKDVLVDSLKFCQERKGLVLFCWCLMTNHIHIIARTESENSLSDILRDLKKYTSRMIIKSIIENPRESRKDLFLNTFREAGRKNSNNTMYQFWQQDNHPIELWSNKVIDQKMNYIHDNPVVAGFVAKPEEYLYSSAKFFAENQGILKVEML